MKILEANISLRVLNYLKKVLNKKKSLQQINEQLYNDFAIVNFIDEKTNIELLTEAIATPQTTTLKNIRTVEYGDFQTNIVLANKVTSLLANKNISPQIIIEPTCGKGNFILAALKQFTNAEYIIGIEIYKPYIWECKFSIIDYYLNQETTPTHKPKINIIHSNIFSFNFKEIATTYQNKNILILGNPPWVTNSKLGTLQSENLPEKSNLKNYSGLEALTGKSNFDIAEFITLTLIKTFQFHKGNIALLIKNTVIKNIIFNQSIKRYAISNIEKHNINSKKEFNVAVEASLFYCELNNAPAFDCADYNFYDNTSIKPNFGWVNDKFVSDVRGYALSHFIDGVSPLQWRQGVKHDCSAIMELIQKKEYYYNKLNEEIILEPNLIYSFLKSSDLKNKIVTQSNRYVIIPQRKVGQSTEYIQYYFPKTYEYLNKHREKFETRKSTIYKGKPAFSIFGVGDYSFQPYKIGISALYQTFHFSLILPQNNKPIILDDTCYMLGFDKFIYAAYTFILLNSQLTTQFLKSITFNESKRFFTKEILMRIDLLSIANLIDKKELQIGLSNLNKILLTQFSLTEWEEYIEFITPVEAKQIKLFV